MSVQTFVPIHLLDVKIFHKRSGHFNLLVALKEKSGGH